MNALPKDQLAAPNSRYYEMMRVQRMYSKYAVPSERILEEVLRRDLPGLRQQIADRLLHERLERRETDDSFIVQMELVVASPDRFMELVNRVAAGVERDARYFNPAHLMAPMEIR